MKFNVTVNNKFCFIAIEGNLMADNLDFAKNEDYDIKFSREHSLNLMYSLARD